MKKRRCGDDCGETTGKLATGASAGYGLPDDTS